MNNIPYTNKLNTEQTKMTENIFKASVHVSECTSL